MKTHGLILCALALAGCNSDSNSSKPQITDTALADRYDQEMMAQIAKAGEQLSEHSIWLRYGDWYQSAPLYMLRMADANNNDPIKAFVINPNKLSDDFQRLGTNESAKLNAYRNDTNMHLANDKLNSLNGMFDFSYDYQTGAAAIWLLKELGYDLNTLESGVNPYHAALSVLGDEIDYEFVLLDVYATTENTSKITSKAKALAKL